MSPSTLTSHLLNGIQKVIFLELPVAGWRCIVVGNYTRAGRTVAARSFVKKQGRVLQQSSPPLPACLKHISTVAVINALKFTRADKAHPVGPALRNDILLLVTTTIRSFHLADNPIGVVGRSSLCQTADNFDLESPPPCAGRSSKSTERTPPMASCRKVDSKSTSLGRIT